jgi:uncharacterized membrane protein (DUF485 family)
MWLITSLIAAFIVTLLWKFRPEIAPKLEILALMLWGLTAMILIDHILGYEGGAFLETETDGLISSGALLGVLMLIPVFIIWVIYVMLAKRKEIPVKE